MVEFLVAIIAVTAVFVGIFAAAELQRADTDTMTDATADAVSSALACEISSSFSPVRDWTPGPDGIAGTKDDEKKSGSFYGVRASVAERTAPNGDWSGFSGVNGAGVLYSDLRDFNNTGASRVFGFVGRRASKSVEIFPAATALFGMPQSVDIDNEVWMPISGGLF